MTHRFVHLTLKIEQGRSQDFFKGTHNRPFPSSPGPLYQNDVKCSAFDVLMIFHSHASKTHFHKKGSALGTRKWSILQMLQTTSHKKISCRGRAETALRNVPTSVLHMQNLLFNFLDLSAL